MRDIATKVDNTTSLTAAEYNDHTVEFENLPKDVGITLNPADPKQAGKAVATYAVRGDFFIDSGAADAYDIAMVDNMQGPIAYIDGLRARFMIGNPNTGASTVDVNGLGAKAIKAVSGTALIAGDLLQDDFVTVVFDQSEDYFILIDSKKLRNDYNLIQTFTAIGSVGSSLQQSAGFVYSLADLQNLLSGGTIRAYYRFAAGANIIDDDTGNFDLTLPGGAADPTNTTGILNTNFAADFVGASNQLFSQATLMDSTSVNFTNGIFIALWFKADDRQPAGNLHLCQKSNVLVQDLLQLNITIAGGINFATEEGNNGLKSVLSTTVLPNGATGWYLVCIGWDTTYGMRLWVNKVLEARDATATTLMGDGTADQFYIGADVGGATTWDGQIAQMIVADMEATQRDVDLLNSVPYTIPAHLRDTDYRVKATMQVLGDTGFVRPVSFAEVTRDATRVFRQGNNILFDPTDTIKLVGFSE